MFDPSDNGDAVVNGTPCWTRTPVVTDDGVTPFATSVGGASVPVMNQVNVVDADTPRPFVTVSVVGVPVVSVLKPSVPLIVNVLPLCVIVTPAGRNDLLIVSVVFVGSVTGIVIVVIVCPSAQC